MYRFPALLLLLVCSAAGVALFTHPSQESVSKNRFAFFLGPGQGDVVAPPMTKPAGPGRAI